MKTLPVLLVICDWNHRVPRQRPSNVEFAAFFLAKQNSEYTVKITVIWDGATLT